MKKRRPIPKNRVEYSRKQIIKILRTLNELVVSLDQIGSASYDMSKAENNAELANFMGPKMFHKLAQARRTLSAAFSRKVGADGMDELEREMQNISYWNDQMKKKR